MSILALAEQFVAALDQLADCVPIERRADWLVMATRLLLLRSRLLFPESAVAADAAQRDAAIELRRIDNLAEVRAAASARPEVQLRLYMIKGFDPAAMAAKLGKLAGQSQGIGIKALDHPVLREAIRSVIAGGTPVVTIASDITQVPRIGYIGIDNRAAGRLAGYLLGRFIRDSPGKVALFAGSLSYRGHEEREMGFRHILAEAHPGLTIVELREVSDDTDRGYAEAKHLLARHPDLAGIYSIGGGIEGIARAMEEAGRSADVILIGHELTEHTRRLLMTGTIDALIDQNPRVEAREAIDLLLQAARGATRLEGRPMLVHAIFRENLPE